MKGKGKGILAVFLAALFLMTAAGCGAGGRDPVTVTLWHVYGADTDTPFSDTVAEFNRTVGKEKGVRVEVTLVSGNDAIHREILAAARHDPGAPELPDLFVAYPKTVLAMPDRDVLLDYSEVLTEEELGQFVPAFLEEGTLDGRLLVLPTAKSTEVLFVNRTVLDRFLSATGLSENCLDTWEGLFAAAGEYSRWTDSLTPDTPGDGKALLALDFPFNYLQVGCESLGEAFWDGDRIAFGPAFDRAFCPLAEAALTGGVWLRSGFASEPMHTGDAAIASASSAGVLYYNDTVTYPDNTTEDIRWEILPAPVLEGGRKLVMQRGAGICTVRSDSRREEACMTFLRWLTEPEHNLDFVTSLGYMPVRQDAYGEGLPEAVEALGSPKYQKLYKACRETQDQYEFYTAPQLKSYLDTETQFTDLLLEEFLNGRDRVRAGALPEEIIPEIERELAAVFGR